MTPSRLDELLERGRRGDAAALSELLTAFTPRIFGMLRRLTNSQEVAEDLLQETVLRVVRTLGAYQHGGKFEAWLFRIAANLARDHLRRRRRRGAGYGLDDGPDGQACDLCSSASERPDEQLGRAELGQRLEQSLSRLNEADREIILLRHFSELSFREIADMLQIPLGTALARAHRALQRLKAEIGQDS